jgi:DNA-binding protein HU-beta
MAKKTNAKATAKKGTASKKQAPKKVEKVEVQKVGMPELVAEVVETSGLSKADVELAVKHTFEAIMNLNAESKNIAIVGFGNFEVRERAERKGRNPQTGEELTISASTLPALKTGATYKKRVQSGQAERPTVKVKPAKVEDVDVTVDVEETVEEPKKVSKKSKKAKGKKAKKK